MFSTDLYVHRKGVDDIAPPLHPTLHTYIETHQFLLYTHPLVKSYKLMCVIQNCVVTVEGELFGLLCLIGCLNSDTVRNVFFCIRRCFSQSTAVWKKKKNIKKEKITHISNGHCHYNQTIACGFISSSLSIHHIPSAIGTLRKQQVKINHY